MSNAYIVTASTITVTIDNEIFTVESSHPNFTSVKEALKKGKWKKVKKLLDIATAIEEFSNGRVEVSGGVVRFKGKEVDNSLTQRILRMMREGFDVTPMANFLENLLQNPSGRAVQELYRFLESNDLPITEDGYFLAYKNVREDFTDRHSGTFDNSVGSVCEMPRNEVMDDPNQTCSAGLHVCSINYLNSFWGHSGHTMIAKINPADVVSVPYDYENSKMRVSRYEIIAEHKDGTKDSLSEHSVYDYTPNYDEGEDYDEWYEEDYDDYDY